ncbi:MAG TPA: GNAT family N-acetyltransferase [Pyrinomonadaceae bacterium]
MQVRRAEVSEIDALAKIWYDGWQDAHAELLPAEIARERRLETFRERLPKVLTDLRTIGEPGEPLGLSITKDDELNQFYVAAESRGKGIAKRLIDEVEQRLAANGVRTAWLACAIGNDRAARFYEKSGWHLARTFTHALQAPDGPIEFDVWRYEKDLPSRSS